MTRRDALLTGTMAQAATELAQNSGPLSVGDLRAALLNVMGRVQALERENRDLRADVARLERSDRLHHGRFK